MLIKKTYFATTLITLSLLANSCNSDDDENNITTTPEPIIVVEDSSDVTVPNDGTLRYTITLRVPGSGSGNGTTDYLTNISSLQEGTLSSTGVGKEQLGWRSYAHYENNIYSIAAGSEDNRVLEYSNDTDKQLEETGSFVFQNSLDAYGISKNDILAIEAPRFLRPKTFYQIDRANLSITNTKQQYIYAPKINNRQVIAAPTSTVIQEDKLYISFYLAAGANATPFTDTAYAAVYTYPNMDLITIMKDSRTGPLGLYGSSNGLITDDNGDLYGFSTASKGAGYSTVDKTSAILRVKNGATAFDQDYYYDFEAASGKKINWMKYLGQGKALARVFTDVDEQWALFPNNTTKYYILNYAIIDLENKSFINVTGIPDHLGQFDAPALIEDELVYVSVTTADEAAVYYIDINTGEGKKGAIIEGEEIAHFSKI